MSDLRDRLLRVFAGIAKDTPANTTRGTGDAAKAITSAADRERLPVVKAAEHFLSSGRGT
jgi:hypothetical protein